ncbi:efflux RND transporter periplasmic adaptor subunit [Lacimicrobium alkaliphilum]|uniref:MexX family efflux pump subunit n=1 Tax=Lacimicrobium alkaliphilum TaxID=1526571 RepID=A0ABQ1RLZ4_9ALTE|nr:efflux RND transporter periplasmic adaptor subunit [Lacimicrobium alkaliphilum]GGD71087.1 MexX family efflux pump subunit [Lacimicrobium alkaliphilum]
MQNRLAIPAILFTFTLVGCGQPQQQAGPGNQKQEVEVVQLQPEPLQLTNELPGRTVDYRQAEIRPQVSGILQKRLFEEGQQVEQGQLLYQIDPASYKATLNSAQAGLARARAIQHNARLKADRFKGLLNSKSVSQQEYDDAEAALMQAEAEVSIAKADVQSAEINLEYTEIRAPISGQIGRSAVTEGALLTANQQQGLATIRQLDPIYVDLTQSASELRKLRHQLENGDLDNTSQADVSLKLEDGTKYEQKGKLKFSEVNVDPSTAMVTLRAVFPNAEGDLLPGMFVRAQVELGTDPDAILVPQKAVAHTPKGDASVMLVNKDDTVVSKVVELGQVRGQRWIVKSGLQAGDRVITKGLQKVQSGAQVTVVTAKSASQGG